MKNKIVTFVLAVCFIIPCVLYFVGCSFTTPKMSVRVSGGYIQYNNGTEWTNVVAIEDLDSEDGLDLSGKEVEFQVNETHIQFKIAGTDEWYNLITIDEVLKMALELMDSLEVGKVEAKQ